ncbi:AT-rich interactive domain-containing protein 1A-like isoform X2 [Scylla paramamosain]|uniref:AT-rich interactive domain-containing protein 1A-like isoform X2 n=1 Tax=Scylla paramamosain TaxID=85552 RepID=UPI00308379FE
MAAALHTPTRLLHLLSLTCLSLLVVAEFTHDRKRVGPLDMVRAEHGCLEKFDVSESTIIRTEDSRMLGAQFLNESDVGNREDCLALCCATRFCNVAVFEEKHSGSCYLFDCGKHEDLKCQFTSHSYYTSAVLRVNRHQLELGLWSEQSQHEAELANLSKGLGDAGETLNGPRSRNLPPTTPPQQPPPTATPHALTSHQPHHHHCPHPPPSTTTTTTTAKPTLPPRKCTRFQFECHSGECIAIYNACDGIPQCSDSSDEDPKLGCPAVSTEAASVSRRLGDGMDGNGPAQPGPWDNSVPAREINPVYDGRIFRNRPTILENYGSYQQNGGASISLPHSSQPTHPSPPRDSGGGGNAGSGGGSRALEDGGTGYGGRGRAMPSYYDTKTRPAWSASPYNTAEGGVRGNGGGGGGGGGGSGGADYLGNPEVRPPFRYPDYGPAPRYPPQPRLPQQPPQLQQQYLTAAHQPQQQPPPQLPQPQQQHQQQHQQQVPPQLNSNPVWMDRLSGYGTQGQPDLHQQMQELHHRHSQLQPQPQEYPPQRPDAPPQDMSGIGGGQNTEMAMGGGGSGRASSGGASVPRGSSASSPLPPSPAPPSTAPTAGPGRNSTANTSSSGDSKAGGAASNTPVAALHEPVKSVAHASHARLEVNLEELQMGAREQDAQASGAVLALAMGVCITALLVVLVGCRLRGVKRRLRRHRGPRSPYAHDADYLVNGMYL